MSEVLNYLRFPLIIGVIFIHNYSTTVVVGGDELRNMADIPMYNYISTLFSLIIGEIAVPLFFLISGYLFFYKVDNFDNSVYLQKLKKRFKSLVIPFLFWNTIFLLIYYFMARIPLLSNFFTGPEYTLDYILHSYWGITNADGTMTYPLAYQFWFIRDLIVCVVLSPILYLLITRVKYFGIVLIGIAWFIGFSIPYLGIRGFSTLALFFFTLGSWCAVHKFNLITITRELKFFGYGYLIIIAIDLFTRNQPFNPYIHKIGILSGIIFCFLITAYLIENHKIRPIPLLTSASFFIFAIHDPWLLSQIRKILYMIIRPESDITFTLLYFVIVIVVVIIALGIYYILKRMAPAFTAFITGGR